MSGLLQNWIAGRGRQCRLSRLARDESGLGALEFALILPIMLTMYIGAVEFGHALTIDRRVTSVASSAADLVAQVEEVCDDNIDDIFTAAESILTPYTTGPLSIVLTSVVADAENKTTVDWSSAHNGTPRPENTAITLPTGLTQPFSSVIMAEVSYTYDPPVSETLTGGITMSETFYLRPRRSLTVEKVPCP